MPGSISIIGSVDGIEQAEAEKVKPRDLTADEIEGIKQRKEQAVLAARELGAALAKAGFGLTVYSSRYIEADVVKGYVESKKARPGSITVCFSERMEDDPWIAPLKFKEYAEDKKLFAPVRDNAPSWEESFYGSLASVDGVVLIGGNYSTHISGIVSLYHDTPVLALRHFGGKAAAVWNTMNQGRHLASVDDCAKMADWAGSKQDQQSLAEEWVASLVRQGEAREAKKTPPASIALRRRQLSAASLLIGWLVVSLVASSSLFGPAWIPLRLYPVFLFLAPLMAGGSGAMIRLLWEEKELKRPAFSQLILGMTAGAITFILWLIGQLSSRQTIFTGDKFGPEHGMVALICAGMGFGAGFALDRVFKKLDEAKDVREAIGGPVPALPGGAPAKKPKVTAPKVTAPKKDGA